MSTTLNIEGISGGHCKRTVAEATEDVPGVTTVSVDRSAGTAAIDGDADVAVLVAAVEDAGYEAFA
ncbi:Copper chaperone CopZ [Halogranum gelatinilyticum]|uniref:Copper chaperone CopZ n=1 Tax=Halogranum gelatinilyticum TaxID=660521 RepID=A0A1G9R5H8_9EURY|nr:heavy-metal-associated domain-containing protein [Halogranum gelatinilyticum]SDM18473.1 Copper chaperone CopZ [Halogranum gelatinilyticum]